MNKILCFLFLLPFLSLAQPESLSEQAYISIITCGPSQDELYSAFGHSAFRVYDPVNRFDAAYNYGVFDFDQPNFYLNFARGYLYYKLGVWDYQRFQDLYIYENRYVHEQVLNLTEPEKQKLYAYLKWNSLPENEYYRYDYFYNNCATKLRDVIDTVFPESVTFDGSYITTDHTIRDLTDEYLGYQPWGDLGIDICLGLPMDKKASPYEYMFLPDFIESGFDHAAIKRNGVAEPLVKKKNIIYESRAQDPPEALPHPLMIFGILALAGAAVTVHDIRKRKISLWFDAVILSVTGSIGLLLFLLWFFTDHKAAAQNFNILWALPTHLIAVVALIKQPRWLISYFIFTFILSILLLILWPVLPQELNSSLLPVVITIAMRSFTQYYVRRIRARRFQAA